MRAWRRYLPGLDLVAAAMALALLFAAVFGADRVISKQLADDAINAAVDIAETDARFLADYWTNIVDRVAHLHAMALDVTIAQQQGDPARAGQALARLQAALSVSLPGFLHVGAADARGFLVWSSLERPVSTLDAGDRDTIADALGFAGLSSPDGPMAPVDLRDREPVKAILQRGHESFVGRLQFGVVSQQPTLFFSKAQRSDDGALIGVSVVSFSQRRAVGLARELTHRPGDLIALIGDGHSILARSDGMGVGPLDTLDTLGTPDTIPTSRRDAVIAAAGRPAGSADGVRRIFVRSPVANSDLSVVIGVNEQAVLAEAAPFQTKLRIAAYAFCFVLTLLAAAAVLAGRQARRIRADRLQAVSETARNDLLHEIADQSENLIAVLDDELRYKFVNGASRAVIGLAPAQIVGRMLGGFLQPEPRDELRAAVRSAAADGLRFHRATVRMFPPGVDPVWIELELSRIEYPAVPGSTRSGWFLIARDVTDRKLAEQELLRANEDLRALAQNGPGALYRVEGRENGDSRLTFIAGGAAGFLGHKAEAWMARGFVKAQVHPMDLPRYRRMSRDRIRGGGVEFEYRLRHGDGHYAWIRDTASVARQPDGAYVITGYAMDISLEKERSAKLDRAQRLLSIGNFASGVGHELGQPLAVISLAAGSATMALQREVPETGLALEKLARIVAMTDRAGAIIENMRMFGRKDAQVKTWTRLADSVADAVEVMRDRLDRERITVVVDVPTQLPALLLPSLLLQQVLINLIANACDAYVNAPAEPVGRRIIRISAWTGQEKVTLRILDRAGGIAPHVLERIFEPFFTTKGGKQGNGLGLSVCYGSIRQAGGLLSVSNRDGGAAFDITLPLPQPDDGDPAKTRPDEGILFHMPAIY